MEKHSRKSKKTSQLSKRMENLPSVSSSLKACWALFIMYIKSKKGLPLETRNTQTNLENRTLGLIESLHMQYCISRINGPRQAKKSDFEHAQNVQIQIILHMSKISTRPLLSIHTFCSIQRLCLRTVKPLIRLRGCAV